MNDFNVEEMQKVSEQLRGVFQIEESDKFLLDAADMIDNCIKMHHKSKDILKPCPFDGNIPVLKKKIIHRDENQSKLKISWEVRCEQCGCSKKGFIPSDYLINNEAELILIGPKYFDKENEIEVICDYRKVVIDEWNERSCTCDTENKVEDPDEDTWV